MALSTKDQLVRPEFQTNSEETMATDKKTFVQSLKVFVSLAQLHLNAEMNTES